MSPEPGDPRDRFSLWAGEANTGKIARAFRPPASDPPCLDYPKRVARAPWPSTQRARSWTAILRLRRRTSPWKSLSYAGGTSKTW